MTATVRPMAEADVDGAVDASAAAFGVDIAGADDRRSWENRIRHPFDSDPEGAFVAEQDGRVVGVGQAMRRDRLWVLSLLTIDPRVQSAGAGRALLGATLGYRRDGDSSLIVSSNDGRALRLYGRAGFRMLPTFEASGMVDRRTLPAGLPPVVDGADDLERVGAISRSVRGASHARELPHALERGSRILRIGDDGYVVAHPGYAVWLLAARDEATAQALLWHGLALVGETDRPPVRWITGDQQWAIEVLLAAGLTLGAYGGLAVQGDPGPLRPFIPSGPFA